MFSALTVTPPNSPVMSNGSQSTVTAPIPPPPPRGARPIFDFSAAGEPLPMMLPPPALGLAVSRTEGSTGSRSLIFMPHDASAVTATALPPGVVIEPAQDDAADPNAGRTAVRIVLNEASLLTVLAPSRQTLRELDLSSCGARISVSDIEALVPFPIEILHMENMRLGTVEAAQLTALPHLKSLYISGNQVLDCGARWLAQIATLTELDIAFNGLTDTGAVALSRHRGLTALSLSGNELGTLASHALARNTHLRRLAIGYCIGDNPARYRPLMQGTHLAHLSLDNSLLSDRAAALIARESNIASLDLHGCAASDDAVRMIARNSRLRRLDISEICLRPDTLLFVARQFHLERLTARTAATTETTGNSMRWLWLATGHATNDLRV